MNVRLIPVHPIALASMELRPRDRVAPFRDGALEPPLVHVTVDIGDGAI